MGEANGESSASQVTRRVVRRVVLRDPRARQDVAEFAEHRGGQQGTSQWLDVAQRWWHKTVWKLPSGLEVWRIEDKVADCRYVQVAGHEMAAVSELLREVEEHLNVWTRRELLDEVANANDPISEGLALMLLGISASVSFDEEIWDTISGAFYSEYEEVRDMAVWASSYSPWTQYRPDLEELLANDESETVRGRARTVLRLHGPRPPAASPDGAGGDGVDRPPRGTVPSE